MNLSSNPTLLLQALAPAVIAVALGAFLLAKGWGRASGATLLSLGLALGSMSLLVAASSSSLLLNDIADSPFVILGVPVALFALTLGMFLRRFRASMLTSVICTAAGLVGLYWLAGFVVMQSACSIHPGGC